MSRSGGVKDERNNIDDLQVVFFPLLAHGHMIPLFDIACLFAAQEGVSATIVTTPANVPVFTTNINNNNNSNKNSNSNGNKISIEVIPFPAEEVGLPPGIENAEHSKDEETVKKLWMAVALLRGPLEEVVERLMASCLVSDMFLPWTYDVAARIGIPRLVFHGSCFFSMSAAEVIRREKPYLYLQQDDDEFIIPGLPDQIRMTKSKVAPEFFPVHDGETSPVAKLLEAAFEVDRKSFGVVMNSFYELEPNYADYYTGVLGKRAWSIGPVSLHNRRNTVSREYKSSIDEQECLKWLDSKPTNSVIYISFGTIAYISPKVLHDLAKALEASGRNFIWVVRRSTSCNANKLITHTNTIPPPPPPPPTTSDQEDYWLKEFQDRNKQKGLVIIGWAPQVLILGHEATGAFLTHCGWNSVMEGLAAGVPMVTWPLFAEQFYNEILVTQILKTGVSVGSNKYRDDWLATEVTGGSEAIHMAITKVMDSPDIRTRAKQVKEMSTRAVGKGGSSSDALNDLLRHLRSYAYNKNI